MPERGGDAAGHAAPTCRDRCRASTSIETLVIDDGSRDGTADVARAVRRRPHRPAQAQQGTRRGVHRRHRRVAQAGRRLHRQHRRRQPVRGRRHPAPARSRCSTARRTSCIGDRNIAGAEHMSWRKRQLQRLGSWVVRQVSNTHRARHDERLPRLHARGGAADDDRVGVLLHARVDHPGGQEADGDRARAGRDQPAHPRVAAVRQHLLATSSDRRRRSCASTRCTSR